MRNQAFSHSSLARCLISKDFYKDQGLIQDDYRNLIIDDAVEISKNLFANGIHLQTIELGNKTGYSVSKFSEKLILRRCVSNIKSSTILPLKSRNQIAKEVIPYLQEGTPYRIYRLDIKSFFESVDIDDVIKSFEDFSQLSTHTKNVISTYLRKFKASFQNGLPRGVEISPILSELILKPFDSIISNHKEVFYYTRFVDDILIITSTFEDKPKFFKWVQKQLLGDLHFNHTKKHIITVKKRVRSIDEAEGIQVAHFNYLGYEFNVTDTRLTGKTEKVANRDVTVDLSQIKIDQLKQKVSKSFYNFHKNHDYFLLKDRLTFLVTNRELKQKKSKRAIPTGIYYNYSAINIDSKKLLSLDNFLKGSITFSRGRLGRLINQTLTIQQKRELLKLSFTRGFKKRIHREYSPNRLKEISRIW